MSLKKTWKTFQNLASMYTLSTALMLFRCVEYILMSYDEYWVLAKDRYGRTMLHLAILHGHVSMVKFLLDQCPDIVKETDNLLRTPLHYAAASPIRRQVYGQIVNQAGGDPGALDVVSMQTIVQWSHTADMTVMIFRLRSSLTKCIQHLVEAPWGILWAILTQKLSSQPIWL